MTELEERREGTEEEEAKVVTRSPIVQYEVLPNTDHRTPGLPNGRHE
jgi:hypothetical protein